MSAPLVSVIMPCFNAGPMLAPALASVIGQTHPNLEVIFVDNNSTDGSGERARRQLASSPRPHQVLTCKRQGVNYARIQGFEAARGDFIQWMDADDALAPDKIALQVAAMQADPTIDLAYGDYAEFLMMPGKPPTHRAVLFKQEEDQIERTLAGVWYPPHLYLIRRAAADRLHTMKAWWPGRPVATDVEYSAIAALMGMRFQHVALARARYNLWSTSQIGSSIAYQRRLSQLEAIYRRLRALSGELVLTQRQRELLEVDWAPVRLDPDKVSLDLTTEAWRLVRKGSGEVVALDRTEASVATALLQIGRAMAPLHIAVQMARGVREVANDPIKALGVLNRFRAEGYLTRG